MLARVQQRLKSQLEWSRYIERGLWESWNAAVPWQKKRVNLEKKLKQQSAVGFLEKSSTTVCATWGDFLLLIYWDGKKQKNTVEILAAEGKTQQNAGPTRGLRRFSYWKDEIHKHPNRVQKILNKYFSFVAHWQSSISWHVNLKHCHRAWNQRWLISF